VDPVLIWKFAYECRIGATKGEGRRAQKRYTQDARRPIQPDIAPFTTAIVLDPVVLSLSIEDGTVEGREGAHLSYPIPYHHPFQYLLELVVFTTTIEDGAMEGRKGGTPYITHYSLFQPCIVPSVNTCILARLIEDGAVEGRRGHGGADRSSPVYL
jgi:hypothetical protein